jgi:hypothetical protein
MALALDGSVHGNVGTGTTLSVSLTTTNSNDVIIVQGYTTPGPISSVTSSGLTFNKRISYAASNGTTEIWYAVATSPLTNQSITVNVPTTTYTTIDAFGISGANTTTIFDSNTGLPATNTGSNVNINVNISTNNPDDFIYAVVEESGGQTSTPSSGFSQIQNADFQLSEYQIVSTTQSNLNVGLGTGETGTVIIVDAIIAQSNNVNFTETIPNITLPSTLTQSNNVNFTETIPNITLSSQLSSSQSIFINFTPTISNLVLSSNITNTTTVSSTATLPVNATAIFRVRALTAMGDYSFGQGSADFLTDAQAVAQCLKTRFSLWAGQWFLNTNDGTPWLTMILGKTSKAVRTYAIQQRIMGTPYTIGITNYVDSLSPGRQLTVSCNVNTQFGTLSFQLLSALQGPQYSGISTFQLNVTPLGQGALS